MAEQFRLITGSNYMFHFAPRPVNTYYFSIIIYSKPFYSQMDHDLDNKLNGHLSFATLNFLSLLRVLYQCVVKIYLLFSFSFQMHTYTIHTGIFATHTHHPSFQPPVPKSLLLNVICSTNSC